MSMNQETTTTDERLWLSAERGAIGSHYALRLIGDDGHQNVGTIHPLAGGGWAWTVDLVTRAGERRTDRGQANDPEEASEQQFDALTRIEPTRFQRIAA